MPKRCSVASKEPVTMMMTNKIILYVHKTLCVIFCIVQEESNFDNQHLISLISAASGFEAMTLLIIQGKSFTLTVVIQ